MSDTLETIVRVSLYARREGGLGVLSTGEGLVAALVLNRADWLAARNYTIAEALGRIGAEWAELVPQAAQIVQTYAEPEG